MINYVNKDSPKNGWFSSKSHKKGTLQIEQGLGFPQKTCYLGNPCSMKLYKAINGVSK